MHLKPEDVSVNGPWLLSGGDLNDKAAGVGMLLSERAQKALFFVNPISPRILLARFHGEFSDFTVIVTYIPPQSRLVDQKKVYDDLHVVASRISKHDCKVIVGDFNSRLARSDKFNNYADCKYVGRWSIHKKDCNGGVLLRKLMKDNDLCAVSTMFQPGSNRTNATWVNPNKLFKPSQIDHILVSNRWKSDVTSCRVKWGRSLLRWGKKQDHGSVIAHFKVRTRVFKDCHRFDVSKLKNEKELDLYSASVAKGIADSISSGIQEDHNGRWIKLKNTIIKSATEILKPVRDPLKKQHFSYMSEATHQIAQDRKNELAKMHIEGYPVDIINNVKRAYRIEISRALRKDYCLYVTHVVKQMEDADAVGNIQAVHSLAKKLQGKGKQASANITTNEQGQPLVSEEERLEVWRRYYEIKFAKAPALDPSIQAIPIPIPSHCGELPPVSLECPTYVEVVKALGALKSGKSPGIDEIPVELLKASPEAMKELHYIISAIWEFEKLPEDWSKGLFVNIYKGKESKNVLKSYRPICLLSHAYKAFAVILLTRLRIIIDARIRTGQEGFRPGRGCADNLMVLRAAINYAIRNIDNTKLEVTLIDFSQAFDTVSHEFLQVACEEHGIPSKYCRLIAAIYTNAVGHIKGFKGAISDPFSILRGVLQGDILSPILFVLCLNSVWSRTQVYQQEDGWRVLPGWLLDELSYADDIILLDTNPIHSERRLQKLSDKAGATAAMSINVPKTHRISICPKVHVGATKQEDITKLNLPFKCDVCARPFPTARGVSCHKRWCKGPGTGEERSRRDQIVDRMVKVSKLDVIVAKQAGIKLNGEAIGNVARSKYLGALIMGHGTDDEEVQTRIEKASVVFMQHRDIWSNTSLNIGLKLRLFRVRVLSMLLYGGETWTLTKGIIKSLRNFAAKSYRSIKSSMNAKRTPFAFCQEEFHEAIEAIDIIGILDKRRWSWLGHVLRLPPHRNPHRALELLTFEEGSLLAHLPFELRDSRTSYLDCAITAASNRNTWKTLFASVCISSNILNSKLKI